MFALSTGGSYALFRARTADAAIQKWIVSNDPPKSVGMLIQAVNLDNPGDDTVTYHHGPNSVAKAGRLVG